MPVAKRALNNVEFLCLKMQAHPGQSGRYYRRALSVYHGAVNSKGEQMSAYFHTEPKTPHCRVHYQVGRYYVDTAERTVRERAYGFSTTEFVFKPVKSEWTLTGKGWEKANQARVKLGLKPIPVPPELLVN